MTTLALPVHQPHWGRPLMAGAALVFLGYAVYQLILGAQVGQLDGRDFTLYRDATERWLHGGGFYEPWQLGGPYQIAPDSGALLYPPVAIYLFLPFLVLPAVLWWAIPLALIAWAIHRLDPEPWAWPFIALCIAWPPTLVKVATGNPVMWALAALAVGVIYTGPAVLVLIKPSLFPFALFGAARRRWWVALGILALVSLPFGSMWTDWLRTVVDGQGGGFLYSVQEVPTLCIPLVARWGSRRRPDQVPGVQFLRTQSNAASPS